MIKTQTGNANESEKGYESIPNSINLASEIISVCLRKKKTDWGGLGKWFSQ